MADNLYAPSRERVITTNAWAFLHWLRMVRRLDVPDWSTLRQFSGAHPEEFRTLVAAFARLPDEPLCLARRSGRAEALVFRRFDGARIACCRDDLRNAAVELRVLAGLPSDIATPLTRPWPPAILVKPIADVLLHADLRPADRVLVIGPAWPWLVALLEGTTVVLATSTAAALLSLAAEEHASVLVAPAQTLAEAAFQRSRRRPELSNLRTIIATGGPLSPEGRRRIYTWVKSDLMLLARTGDTIWGNPLEPVLLRPVASPALLTPPPSAPATP
jgi:hypothetical protein